MTKLLTLTALMLALPALPVRPEGVATVAHAEDSREEHLQTVRIQITGMVTKSCPTLVEAAVSRIDGVEEVQASLESRSADVRYHPSRTSPEAIIRVIKDQVGFEARAAR